VYLGMGGILEGEGGRGKGEEKVRWEGR
jgi:hypothetical protein